MFHHLKASFRGDGFRARAMRSSAIVVFGFGTSNVLRLASNLLLTRLLFPEAFGLMSLVYVFVTGLHLFSDVGLNLSIVQNKRGDDPSFLNTVWSIQILRGALLWLGACLLAYPVSLVYAEPRLAMLLPVVGFTACIQGFTTTNAGLADRNLQIGTRVMTDLVSQVATLVVTMLGAWLTGSVWSLVAGAVFGAFLKVFLQNNLLKGPKNSWHLDPALVGEILHFGKYIFLGSVAGFLINQGDRAILGGFVSLTDLGIFTVGLMFALVPSELARSMGGQIILPLFSKFPPSAGPDNRSKIFRARRLVNLSMVCASGFLSLVSIPMVDFLYDSRYHDAGPILALLGFTVTAQIATANYDGSYLGAGDSRQHFRLVLIQAVVQVAVSLLLISHFGILGAIFTLCVSELFLYPFKARAAYRYQSWDPKTDLLALAIGWGCAALGIWMWHADIMSFVMA
nr:oligosaccharide flippase family protein [uncultured Devosia sp.]